MLLPDGKKKYVKLVAQFGSFHRAEKVIAVSFRSGHIFIQTDKPVYNPGDAGQLSHAVEHIIPIVSALLFLSLINPDFSSALQGFCI